MKNETTTSRARTDAARRPLTEATTIVVKLGTNIVSRQDGELAMGRLHGIIEDITMIVREGKRVILVSSGAVGLGRGRIEIAPDTVLRKQACAAVGQVLLMSVYEQAFMRMKIPVAQLLLTELDFREEVRFNNLMNTIGVLLETGCVPIINENDPVSTAELQSVMANRCLFGDNDKLSALVASHIDADLLVILTDVDGLYRDPTARESVMDTVTDPSAFYSCAMEHDESSRGRGGMLTKLEAMRLATDAGCRGIIANGTITGVLEALLRGESHGTLFLPRTGANKKK